MLKTSAQLNFHQALTKRKYRLLFSPIRRRNPGPTGPCEEFIDAIVATKLRNPSWGCPRIAQQNASALGVSIDNDLARPILSTQWCLSGFEFFDPTDSPLVACAFAPDGKTIIAGEQSGAVHLLWLEELG